MGQTGKYGLVYGACFFDLGIQVGQAFKHWNKNLKKKAVGQEFMGRLFACLFRDRTADWGRECVCVEGGGGGGGGASQDRISWEADVGRTAIWSLLIIGWLTSHRRHGPA